MSNFIYWLIEIIVRSLPDETVEEINRASLDELDVRGLIIWADGGNNEN
ncbi:hypothetical protein H6F74_05660 [Trichocoleus sp. FACHB-90]|nr:hypothetical protein [Trichocoleus sp. FACHB-90]MBD1925769.1 hypothetical protein [Trichocoleus sp. FACHB-90]